MRLRVPSLDLRVFRHALVLWLDIRETCTYLCCLCFSFSVRVFLAVSSFFLYTRCFINKFGNSWGCSGILAYLVDANNGRSSTAVALNSVCRGDFSFVATEITVPLQLEVKCVTKTCLVIL